MSLAPSARRREGGGGGPGGVTGLAKSSRRPGEVLVRICPGQVQAGAHGDPDSDGAQSSGSPARVQPRASPTAPAVSSPHDSAIDPSHGPVGRSRDKACDRWGVDREDGVPEERDRTASQAPGPGHQAECSGVLLESLAGSLPPRRPCPSSTGMWSALYQLAEVGIRVGGYSPPRPRIMGSRSQSCSCSGQLLGMNFSASAAFLPRAHRDARRSRIASSAEWTFSRMYLKG